MNAKRLRWASLGMLMGLLAWLAVADQAPSSVSAPQSKPLCVVWTSGDPDVAHRMCLMYAHAAKKQSWFKDVTLVVWGPSARLLAGDSSLQKKVQEMAADGVRVEACVVCADSYGVTERLRELGLTVRGMGMPLTEMVKSDWHVLTF